MNEYRIFETLSKQLKQMAQLNMTPSPSECRPRRFQALLFDVCLGFKLLVVDLRGSNSRGSGLGIVVRQTHEGPIGGAFALALLGFFSERHRDALLSWTPHPVIVTMDNQDRI